MMINFENSVLLVDVFINYRELFILKETCLESHVHVYLIIANMTFQLCLLNITHE